MHWAGLSCWLPNIDNLANMLARELRLSPTSFCGKNRAISIHHRRSNRSPIYGHSELKSSFTLFGHCCCGLSSKSDCMSLLQQLYSPSFHLGLVCMHSTTMSSERITHRSIAFGNYLSVQFWQASCCVERQPKRPHNCNMCSRLLVSPSCSSRCLVLMSPASFRDGMRLHQQLVLLS